MENLQTYFEMVDQSIRDLGVDPALCRGEKAGQWSLKKGSASVWVDIWHIEQENRGYFQVLAPVMQIPPTNQQAFFQELLELNYTLYGVAFVKFNDWIYVKLIRECEGLEQKEVAATMNRVGWYADEYDDKLKLKYGITVAGRG
ncbi:MAG: YbjN domain-containing protein [Bacteroidota bacterium]|nr:YbjN domain-containing protein [Bacteroidota bacterium]